MGRHMERVKGHFHSWPALSDTVPIPTGPAASTVVGDNSGSCRRCPQMEPLWVNVPEVQLECFSWGLQSRAASHEQNTNHK